MKTFLICYTFVDDRFCNYLNECINADTIEDAIHRMRYSKVQEIDVVSAQQLVNNGKLRKSEDAWKLR